MAEKTTFEQAMKTLRDCAGKMSDPELTLEEAMAGYAEGVAAYKTCRAILDEAEQTIRTMEEDQA